MSITAGAKGRSERECVCVGVYVIVAVGVHVDSRDVYPTHVLPCISLFVPSGQIVFDQVNASRYAGYLNVALRALAPLILLLRISPNVVFCRLAPVKST